MSTWFSILACGAVFPADDSSWNSTIPPAMKRKDPRIWQMAYIAASRALNGTDIQCKSIISATALGALDETKNFLDGVFGDGFGSPRNFIASVHNSMAGKLALDFKIPGPNLTVCDGHTSMASALAIASLLQDQEFPALLLLIDERIALFEEMSHHFTQSCKPYIQNEWKEAAIVLCIDKSGTYGRPQIRGLGPSIAYCQNPEESCMQLGLKNIDNFSKCDFMYDTSSTSYIQPAIEIQSLFTSEQKTHAAIGAYSPVSRGVSLVEYRYE